MERLKPNYGMRVISNLRPTVAMRVMSLLNSMTLMRVIRVFETPSSYASQMDSENQTLGA